jgi:hypothetical protein
MRMKGLIFLIVHFFLVLAAVFGVGWIEKNISRDLAAVVVAVLTPLALLFLFFGLTKIVYGDY